MKERLLREGFPDWTRNDYHQFIRACEQLGRGDVAAIIHSVTVKTGKSEEEVQRYYDVFWEKGGRKRGLTFRAPEMEEFSGILARIEKGEAKLSRKDGVEQVRERGVIQG